MSSIKPPAENMGLHGPDGNSRPDHEVFEKPLRRRFSAEYKLRILGEIDSCRAPGEIGAVLRREGLYSSLISKWRFQQRAGSVAALTDAKRGRPKRSENPLAAELSRLERENGRLREGLRKAEIIIDVQKKIALLLGTQDHDEKNGSS